MPAPRTLRLLALCPVGVALLAGCAQPPTIPPYVAETGPYMSRLLVRTSLQPKEAFGVYLHANAQTCTDSQRVFLGNSQATPDPVLIRAERLTTLSSTIVANDGRCHAVASFVPRSGRSYAITLATKEKQCWSLVYDVTDPDKTFLEPSLRRRDNTSNHCLPLAASRAPGASGRSPELPLPSASAPAVPPSAASTPR